MSDIEVVIKIPEAEYKNICLMSKDGIGMALYDWIANGTPLPKGHGRLIDVAAIKPKFCDSNIYIKYGEKGFWYYSVKDVNDTPTIIEADKE